jgi:hypothetical protein
MFTSFEVCNAYDHGDYIVTIAIVISSFRILVIYSVEKSPSWEADSRSCIQKLSEPECSLPPLQQPAIAPYCEPGEVSPHSHTLFL